MQPTQQPLSPPPPVQLPTQPVIPSGPPATGAQGQLFDVQGAIQAGHTMPEIQQFMAQNNLSPMPAQPGQAPAKSNGILDWLPTIGAVGGGILGSAAGPVGSIGGAGFGGAGGEFLKRKIMEAIGQDPNQANTPASQLEDLTASAGEGVKSALFEGLGLGVGKVVGEAAPAIAKLLGLAPEALAKNALKLGTNDITALNKVVQPDFANGLDWLLKEGVQAPDQMMAKAVTRQTDVMTQLDAGLLAAGQAGKTIPTSSLVADLENLKSGLNLPGVTEPSASMKPAIDYIDEKITQLQGLGDTLLPSQAQDWKKALYQEINGNFADGPLTRADVKQKVSLLFKDAVEGVFPGAKPLNQTYAAFEVMKPAIERAQVMAQTGPSTFGSAIQSAMVGFAGGPGAAATSFLANQTLKNPASAAKLANVMYKIAGLGDAAAPIAKTFFNAVGPVIENITKNVPGGVGSAALASTPGNNGGPNDIPPTAQLISSGQSAAATQTLAGVARILPTQYSATSNVPGGEFTSPQQLTSATGQPLPHTMGLTRQDAALAIMRYPTQAALITSIYGLLKDPTQDLNDADKKSLLQVNGAQAIANMTKQQLSQLQTGRVVGVESQIAAKLGFNPTASTYDAFRQASIGPLARAISGEVGMLTDNDIARAAGLLPTLTDTPQEVRMKLSLLDQAIAQKHAMIGANTLNQAYSQP